MIIEVTYNVTDVYMSTTVSPIYISVDYSGSGGSGASVWGSITGTLSNQTDLQTALDGKFDDPTGTTTEYIDGTGALQTFPLTLPVLQQVRNQTGSTLAAGTVVYISGATGNLPTVSKAIATGDSTSAQTLGMISAAIINNGTGYVVVIGTCSGLDTSAYSEGQQLYLSGTTAGAVTTTKPYAPIHLVYIGIVTRAHPNLGTIEVRVQNGFELEELHDVDAFNPSNNDGLFYNSGNELWEHKPISTVLGYTPEQPLTFSSPLSRSTNTVSIPAASSSANGYLSSTDWSTFNSKQGTITLTTTGTSGAATLVGSTLNIPQYSGGGGMAIGGSITFATAGSVLFAGTSGVLAQDNSNLFWDNTNKRFGIGTASPQGPLHINSDINVNTNGLTITRSGVSITDANFQISNATGVTGQFIPFFQSTSNSNIGLYLSSRISNTSQNDIGTIIESRTKSGGTLTQGWLVSFRSVNTDYIRISALGNLVINNLTDNGNKLQVDGSVSFGTSFKWDNVNARIGVRNSTPGAAFDVWNNGAEVGQYRLSDSRITIPNYSSLTFNPSLTTNTIGLFSLYSSSTGGTGFYGFTSNVNNGVPLGFIGNHGGTSPTTPAIKFIGFKHDGSANRTPLTGSEIIAGFSAGFNTDVLQVLANGNTLINTTTDAGFRLDVNGTMRVQGDLTLPTSGAKIIGSSSGNMFVFSTPSGTRTITMDASGGLTLTNQYVTAPYYVAGNTSYRDLSITSFGSSAIVMYDGGTGDMYFKTGTNRNLILDAGQNGGANRAVVITSSYPSVGTSYPAKLVVNSTTQGFLPPRMTTTQKNAITSPVAGLMVYDTTLNKLCVYTTAWETITSA